MNVMQIVSERTKQAQAQLSTLVAKAGPVTGLQAALERARAERSRLFATVVKLPTVTKVQSGAQAVFTACAHSAAAVRAFGRTARLDASLAAGELRESVHRVLTPPAAKSVEVVSEPEKGANAA
jgi:hypothetical protein